MSLNREKTTINKKAFEGRMISIRKKKLIDTESMFYNPYKAPVPFKATGKTKVVSQKFVI